MDYSKVNDIQYELLKDFYLNDILKKDGYKIYYSNKITDQYWNYAILETKLNSNLLKNIEEEFNKINRKPAILIPKDMDNKDLLIKNNYKLLSEDAFMFLEDNFEYPIVNQVKIVKNKQDYNDFMEVMMSAYEGEANKDNPYSGSITKEYHEAILETLERKDTIHFVLYVDNIPVSVATLSYDNDYGLISNVGTKSNYQNKGFGKELLTSVIKYFKNISKGKLFLVTENDSKNERWYIKQGFKTLLVMEEYYKNN